MTLEEFLKECAETLGEKFAEKLQEYFARYPEYGPILSLHLPILARLAASEISIWCNMVVNKQPQAAELMLLRQMTPEERHRYRLMIAGYIKKLNLHYEEAKEAMNLFIADLLQALLQMLITLLSK